MTSKYTSSTEMADVTQATSSTDQRMTLNWSAEPELPLSPYNLSAQRMVQGEQPAFLASMTSSVGYARGLSEHTKAVVESLHQLALDAERSCSVQDDQFMAEPVAFSHDAQLMILTTLP